MSSSMSKNILKYWFPVKNQGNQSLWFGKKAETDEFIKREFLATYNMIQAERNTLGNTNLDKLATIIVLDQFSRNMFRNSANMFKSDSIALTLSMELVESFDKNQLEDFTPHEKVFSFMPLMHSEDSGIHNIALRVFGVLAETPGMEGFLKFEIEHSNIVKRFGRYPHRNQLLGRKSTPEEIEFLKTPGSSF